MRLFGRPKQTVGLDIGSGLVKAVVLDHAGSAPELVRAVVTPLADDAIVEGEVMDPALVIDAVRATIAATGTANASIAVAVGGRDVIVKRIRAPRARGAEARALLRWEAEQHVPFDMSSVALDFHVLDPDGDEAEMGVLIAAAKRELVDARIALLAEAGVVPAIVDVDAFALHNAYTPSTPASAVEAGGGLVALAHVGNETTIVNVLDGDVPVLTRDLSLGTRRLREDLQRELALSAPAADALLRGERPSPALAPLVVRHAEDLAAEVERATAVLNSGTEDAGPLRALFLSGGGARVPGLAAATAARLRVRVESVNTFGGIAVANGALDGVDAEAVSPLLLLALGLGVRHPVGRAAVARAARVQTARRAAA
ncbi:MAG: pilus assembly protein PilM, partial [Candidatus Eremiobacteraeota bacterium]|nr:pilus assembly protein PilM [Candidatus Eremiobacteraeota bacterium]